MFVGSSSMARMASAVIVYEAGVTPMVSQLNDSVPEPFAARKTDRVSIRLVSYVTLRSKVSS